MHPRDWRWFLDHGAGRAVCVAQLSRDLADGLGAADTRVYLEHSYARKAVEKHDLSAVHFPMIFETVDYGTAIADRVRHLTFLHYDRNEWEGWFQVTVKSTPADQRIWIATFYKTNAREVSRKLKRHRVVRK